MSDFRRPATAELAAQAQALIEQRSVGTLATLSKKHPGYPFATLTPYALDQERRPLLLLSGLATHTKNVMANPAVSLCVCENEALSGARATLLGDLRRVEDQRRDAGLQTYVTAHPEAREWVSFGDFALWHLEVKAIYFVGGFGQMGWVPVNAD